MSTEIKTLAELTQELVCEHPVFVKMHASWCGPCKSLQPTIDELNLEYTNRVKFLSVNIDDAHEITHQFGIRSVPTVLLFKDGQVVDVVVGAQSKSKYQQAINTIL
jgi:thioredoxin 1